MMLATIPEDRDAGFTLVEMLVSLAVVAMAALLMAIGVGRMGLDLSLSRRGDARLDDVVTAQFALRQRIELTFPAKDPQTGNTLEFAGLGDSIDFIGKAPDNVGPDVLNRYRIRLAHDGTLTLYRVSTLTTTIDPRQPTTDGWAAVPLVKGVRALAISYFGARQGNNGNGWQDAWVHRQTLPRLVRLRLDFPEGDERGWPELVVRLHAAISDTCDRDLRTDECKGAE